MATIHDEEQRRAMLGSARMPASAARDWDTSLVPSRYFQSGQAGLSFATNFCSVIYTTSRFQLHQAATHPSVEQSVLRRLSRTAYHTMLDLPSPAPTSSSADPFSFDFQPYYAYPRE